MIKQPNSFLFLEKIKILLVKNFCNQVIIAQRIIMFKTESYFKFYNYNINIGTTQFERNIASGFFFNEK